MTNILVLRNKPVFKGLFIHLIGCEHDQNLGPPFFHVFKLVGHWPPTSKNALLSLISWREMLITNLGTKFTQLHYETFFE